MEEIGAREKVVRIVVAHLSASPRVGVQILRDWVLCLSASPNVGVQLALVATKSSMSCLQN